MTLLPLLSPETKARATTAVAATVHDSTTATTIASSFVAKRTNFKNDVVLAKTNHMPRQQYQQQQQLQQQQKFTSILLLQMLTATATAAAATTTTTATKIIAQTTTATIFLTPTAAAAAATFYQQMNDTTSTTATSSSGSTSSSDSTNSSGSNGSSSNNSNSSTDDDDNTNNIHYQNITLKAALDTIDAVNSYLSDMAWPKALCVAIFLLLILITIVGNTLVILAVLTTRRLRTVTNCFVMNLAITDWLVGMCVMPPAVMKYVVGNWRFGWILCDIWISLDVLLCTGSILSLCAISLDRYLAVTQPLTYSKKRRSKRLALFMIFIVWVTALSITCPPFLGWYEPGRRKEGYVDCRYNQNKGYVVFSAMGSFFIPLAVMLYVYLKIGYVLTSRRQRIVRDANSERTADHDIDCDNFLSESEHFQCATPKFPSFKTRWSNVGIGSKQNSLKCSKCDKNYNCGGGGGGPPRGLTHQASFYELVEVSRLSSLIHCSTINCKYGSPCMHATAAVATSESRASTLPLQSMHYTESRSSFSETCLAAATVAAQTVKFVGEHHQQQQHQQQSKHVHHHPHPHQNQHHSHRVPMRVSTTKRDTKTTKTLTIVMGGFIACWLPFFIYYILIPFLPPAAVFEGLMNFLTWVGWVNCGINPFIYAFYNPDFRTAFWRLTCRRICKQKPANHLAMFRGG